MTGKRLEGGYPMLVALERNAPLTWGMPPYKAERRTLAKYIRSVKNASQGCVTDE